MCAFQTKTFSRAVLDSVVSEAKCRQLVELSRLAVIGYRTAVCSFTIDDIVRQCPSLLPALVAAREAVRTAVEEALGLFVLVEFTGLISWRPGSAIGWHHDGNRPYLRQRSLSAVCYLNTAGTDFQGGTFRFQSGEPAVVHAAPGRVVAYSARDVHSVDAITAGERFTLTLWFTEQPDRCEDTRLLAQLPGLVRAPLGLPPSMWRLPDGTDLRLCRLALAGFAVVRRGRMLHGLDGLPEEQSAQTAGLKLAVQPQVLRAWLQWQRRDEPATASAGPGGSSGAVGHDAAADDAGTAVVVHGIEFGSIQQAVLEVHHFMQRMSGASSRERVCRTHLCEAAADQPAGTTCAWIRSCQLRPCAGLACGELPFAAEEMQRAQADCRRHLGEQRAALERLLPRWLQVGALFPDDSLSHVLV